MRTQVDWVLARLTASRWTVVVGFSLAPVLAVFALVGGIALGSPKSGAIIALVILGVSVVGVVAIAVILRRQYARSVLAASGITLGAKVRGAPTVDLLTAHALATRSPVSRDLLARAATAGRYSYRGLTDVVGSDADASDIDLALGRVEVRALSAIARVLISNANPEDEAAAVGILRRLTRHEAWVRLPGTARQTLLEELVLKGLFEEAERVLAGRISHLGEYLVSLDILNPFVHGAKPMDGRLWLAALSTMFESAGLEPVRLTDGPIEPFDRLVTSPVDSVDGPLVSIVMTAYNPNETALKTAIESVRAQSWSNWELILIDDGSSRRSAGTYDGISDSRVRVIRERGNKGTYVRRNEGIGRANGDYITMFDADDWMHPRRLERQMRHLLASPVVLANTCRSLRATSKLGFVQPRGTFLGIAESSLLIRSVALERVGYFDSIRKGADTTFRLRLERDTGAPVPSVSNTAPLVLTRFDASSLSGGDLRDGWTHPSRVAYSSAHAHWVATERMAGRTPRFDFPLDSRPFPVPPALVGQVANHDLDVLFVLDPRDHPRRRLRSRKVDAEIRRAVRGGKRVGVLRVDALASASIPSSPRSSIQAAINAGDISEVLAGDRTAARVVVVFDESCLIGVPAGPHAITAGRVLCVSSSPGRGVYHDASAARDGAVRLTGRSAELVSPVDARAVVDALA